MATKSIVDHHTAGITFDTVFSKQNRLSECGLSSSCVSFIINAASTTGSIFFLLYLAICPFACVTLGEDYHHHLVRYHSRSLSTTVLVCVEMFRAKFGFHRRLCLPLSSCLRPREEGWHCISFQPLTLSESVNIVLFRKPNKPTPMCKDLHQQNAAHAKQGFGHLERNCPSPSSQMQFPWVGWPTPLIL